MSEKVIVRNVEAVFEPKPEELASILAAMDADEQARFFSHLHKAVSGWDRPFAFQMQAVTDSTQMTDGGRAIMSKIGEYAYAC